MTAFDSVHAASGNHVAVAVEHQTLRWLAANLPRTSVDFIRIGQDALERATTGTLRLTYLYRPIAPVKGALDPVVAPPPGAIGDEVPDE